MSFRADIFNLFNTVNFMLRRHGREQREFRQADGQTNTGARLVQFSGKIDF